MGRAGAELVSAAGSPGAVGTLNVPSDCVIYGLYPNPAKTVLAIELECQGGPQIDFYDIQAGQRASLGTAAAHFLAWAADGRFVYLKTGGVDNPQIVRIDEASRQASTLDLPADLYDLAVLPDGRLVYSTTRGLGFGSETWLADASGRHARRILSEPGDIVAYLRPSPDGKQLAFIRFPDSQTPFPDGELWIMDTGGKNARSLGEADAGHGYAPAWSPDGSQLAVVGRDNPTDPQVEQSASALHSNVYRVQVRSGVRTPVSTFAKAVVETPVWSPDGLSLYFNVAENDTIQVWYEQAGVLQPLNAGASCCAIWVPGK